MKVLVTGATSMLGAGLVRALLARGDEVTVLQRRPSGLPCREVLGDVADARAVSAAVVGREAVVHLAAKVHVVGAGREFVRVNVEGTRNVVDAASRAPSVDRLVHVSTPSVAYTGSALVGVGAGPADPARAQGHYARTKAVAEQLVLGADRDGLAVVAIRPHLVWGPGDTQLIGRIVERARSGRLALVGSGAALIDTTYVDNAVDALVCALDRARVVDGEALVVSNGEPRTVAELFAAICAAAGVPAPRRHVPPAVAWTAGVLAEGVWSAFRVAGDPPMTRFLAMQLATAHWFDQRRTRELLQWRPAVTLDEGLRRLADSMSAIGNTSAPCVG